MTLDEVRNQLSAYLDGELDEATRREVETALRAHPELRAELDGLRRTIELVRSLPRAGAPAALGERVRTAISSGQGAASPRRELRHWRTVALLAAACLLVALTALVLRPRQPRDQAVSTGAADRAERHERAKASPMTRQAAGEAEEQAARAGRKLTTAAAEPLSKDARDLAMAREGTAGRGTTPGPAAPGRAPAPGREERSVAEGTSPRPARPSVEPAHRPDVKTKPAEPAEQPAATTVAQAPARKPEGFAAEVKKEAAEAYAEKPEWPSEDAARGKEDEFERSAQGTDDRAALKELVTAIQRNHFAGQPGGSGMPWMGAAAGMREGPGGERTREVVFPYSDLARVLADARAALDAANVTYVVQPVGAGQFVVEAALPASEVEAVLALLTGTAKDGERQVEVGGKRLLDARKMRATADADEDGAPKVRLVLRFVRAEDRAAAAAKAAEPPAEKVQKK
jgi:hypothetical protein